RVDEFRKTVSMCLECVDIASYTEGFPYSSNHHNSSGRVVTRRMNDTCQALGHFIVQCVARVRPIKGDRGNPPRTVEQDFVSSGSGRNLCDVVHIFLLR